MWPPVLSLPVPLVVYGRGLGAFNAIADAIMRQEGITASSPYYSLNNPGMLVYAGQRGATPVTVNGVAWASFPTYDDGYQALLNQIALDASRGETISDFTAKYAPAGHGTNDPAIYAQNLAASVGLSPSDLLSSADIGMVGGTPGDDSVYALPENSSSIPSADFMGGLVGTDDTMKAALAIGGVALVLYLVLA